MAVTVHTSPLFLSFIRVSMVCDVLPDSGLDHAEHVFVKYVCWFPLVALILLRPLHVSTTWL